MAVKIGRSIWGIQPGSFHELRKYLQTKHSQQKGRLYQLVQDLQNENKRIQMRIDFFYSPGPETFLEAKLPEVHASPIRWEESWFETQYRFTIRFKKSIFGLNSKKVKLYLRQLLKMQQIDLEESRQKLNILSEKHKKLLFELSSLENIYNANAEEEAAASLPLPEQETNEDNENLEDEENREEEKEEIKFQEKMREQFEAEWRERLEEQIKELMLQKLKGQLLVGGAEAGEKEESWIGDIKELMKQKILKEQKQNDGYHSKVIASQPKGKRRNIFSSPTTFPKLRLTVNGSSFWDEDIESLLSQYTWDDEDGGFFSAPSPSFPQPEIKVENGNNHQDYHIGSIESKGSPAITNQVHLLKKKYIVGKLAGSDLKDSGGKMIISKNEVITEQVMNQAEEEGKLAELIVNMVIPGLGD